jgi:hypothetical protein
MKNLVTQSFNLRNDIFVDHLWICSTFLVIVSVNFKLAILSFLNISTFVSVLYECICSYPCNVSMCIRSDLCIYTSTLVLSVILYTPISRIFHGRERFWALECPLSLSNRLVPEFPRWKTQGARSKKRRRLYQRCDIQ